MRYARPIWIWTTGSASHSGAQQITRLWSKPLIGVYNTIAVEVNGGRFILISTYASLRHIIPRYISMLKKEKCKQKFSIRKLLTYPQSERHTARQWTYRNEKNQHSMTKIRSDLNATRIHQHVSFQPIPPMGSKENDRKPQIWHVVLCQNVGKMWKINRLWLNCNQF